MTAGALCPSAASVPSVAPVVPLLARATRLTCAILPHLALVFAVAWMSHHMRDATRRGLWFAPLGSTPPLPRWVYLGGVLGAPLALHAICRLWRTGDGESYADGFGTSGVVEAV